MPTIAGTLRLTAARVPDREALVHGDVRHSYAELDAHVDRVAAVLLERGVAKGDRVALMSTNSDRFVIALYATARVGAVVVPVNPASAAPELDYLIRDSGAATLIFDPTLSDAVRTAVANGLPDGLRIFATYPAVEFEDLFALAAEQPGGPVEVEVSESDNAEILYTSGTTGNPKGALFDHYRIMWEATASIATIGLKDGDRLLHVAPFYHSAELNILLIPGTLIGATHVIHNSFDPVKVLETLERERVTLFFGVPTMFQLLLRQPNLAKLDLTAWRTGLFGAAPMPASAVQQLVAAFPSVEFMNLCGQTEAGPGGIFLNHQQVLERPEASGRQALITMEVRIVDPEGNDVAPGEVGEMILRGVTMMKEYWNKPEATAETLVDGWIHTGDLTRLDADGYMTLVDRLKDMIITGGHNVYSVEVENAIAAHPAVLDCAVVSRPHEIYGESIVAVAVIDAGASLDLAALREFCGSRITHYKLPHDLVIVDSIPRNPSGKILKRIVRKTIAAE
ncbi:class I adenylate-forming enzyme family protein [Rhodococcus sp. ARC_M6]|uniref:class I adenylate-forming enzyme family protein n=1 Tax=Rhodococcus sp. ARC_M6 TaxID=2928852 RepID=UPI001FB32087|nr:long-chain fatty acid--CoA ligase [Rhodococcus sp. ARC_M6]MCJ0907289.1 long-chain fatty acid--CoA ligase [Rhodococcus sp. ARC_M6]